MNRIALIGRVVADIELKTGAQSGKEIAPFRLAVPRPGKNDETDFIDCVAFDKRAQIINQYVHKGDKIGVTGCLNIKPYKDKNGVSRISVNVICDSVEFLTDKKKDDGAAPTVVQGAAQKPAQTAQAEKQYDPYDDLPF